MPQVGEPRAKEAVPDLEPVIEKAERTISGQRREPEREARKLDSHRIEIDAVEAAFRNGPANRDALGFADVVGMATARADDRQLVGGRKIPARRDEKRA